MSLNDFKINSITASTLYPQGITILSAMPQKKEIDKKTKILIILNTAINKEYTNWLEKVLAYCKLTMDDVCILSFDSEQNIEMIQAKFQPAQIWLFGISSHALGMKSIKTLHFEAATYNDIICLPLPRIETFFDTQIMKEHKRALLFVLKKLFQIT